MDNCSCVSMFYAMMIMVVIINTCVWYTLAGFEAEILPFDDRIG